MAIFWYEFLFFATAMFGILVAFSSASLFYRTLRVEGRMNTAWRATGFFLLVISLILYILERKFGFFGVAGVIVEAVAFFAIYRGVLAEPKLSHLTKTDGRRANKSAPLVSDVASKVWGWALRIGLVALIVAVVLVALWLIGRAFAPAIYMSVVLALGGTVAFALTWVPFLLSFIALLSLVFILLTIRLQVRRYKGEKNKQARRNNLWPLIGYAFFAVRAVMIMGYRLPEIDLVWTRIFSIEYSLAWIIAALATLLAYFFLALWAWRFIKVRFFLRTYVVFLALSIAVATAGVLIFSILIFQVVEKNNLDLMARGANTEALIMVERKDVAETLARLLAEDPRVASGAVAFDPGVVSDRAEFFRQQTNVDVIRFYSPEQEVLSSPTDRRDIGRVFSDDAMLKQAIQFGKPVGSFDIMPGVLSTVVVGRALHPTIGSGSAVTGVVEIAYVFDNAFVDYSKRETELEVTIYSGRERSASTIKTADGTSRWVGSNETEQEVLSVTLQDGVGYQTALDRLGIPYYSAFLPVRNADYKIIGMISVGVPTNILLEDARQRFLTSFFMATLISFLAAVAGYFAFRSFGHEQPGG